MAKVTELNIKQKNPLGSGAYHGVFPFERFQDKVVKSKLGRLEFTGNHVKNVDKSDKMNLDEINVFKRYPNLFAKVYTSNERYAILEKLDQPSLEHDINGVSQGMLDYLRKYPKKNKFFTSRFMRPEDLDASVYLNLYMKNDKTLIKGIFDYTKDKKFFMKLVDFLYKLDNIDLPRGYRKMIDIQKANMGYDKDKNIKMLDI